MAGNNGGTWLRDALSGPDGEKSSKRLVGFSLSAIGVLWLIVSGIINLATGFDVTMAIQIGERILYSGVGLLGFGTLAERISR